MNPCDEIVTKIVNEITKTSQISWFLNIKNFGGFINNLDNPKLKALKNTIQSNISDTVWIVCCYTAQYIITKNNTTIIDIEAQVYYN